MAKKLYVRHSKAEDEKAVFDFYTGNPHNFVAKRDRDLWKERIASGAVTIIEDDKGKIMAAAITYPVTKKNAAGEDVHAWSEIGSVRVALDGVGLFKPLLSALVTRAFLLEPPEDRFAIEIVNGNDHSKHVFEKEGAVPFNAPKALLDKVAGTMAPDDTTSKDMNWFQLSIESMPHLAQNMLDCIKNPKLVNKKTGEEYELDFSKSVVVSFFKPALEKIAGNNYGDAKKPDMSQGLKKHRNRLGP